MNYPLHFIRVSVDELVKATNIFCFCETGIDVSSSLAVVLVLRFISELLLHKLFIAYFNFTDYQHHQSKSSEH